MFFPEYVYLSCVAFLVVLLLFAVYKLYKFSLFILELETSIEQSLDILDHHYKKMNDILQKPIFFDSVEIRQVVEDIRSCHSAVLLVANKLTSEPGIESEIKEEDAKDQ